MDDLAKQKRQAYNRAYYEAHKDAHKAAMQAWRAAHPEENNAIRREWDRAHPEQYRARNKRWRARNAEHCRQKDSLTGVARVQRRRARRKAAPLNDFTAAQWREMQAAYGFRCVYCPDDCPECQSRTHALTQDHIIPLSQGGNHTRANIVPACMSCNAKKGVGAPLRPIQPLLL